MTFLIGQTVTSRVTNFEYEVTGHDEPTIDGREVVIVKSLPLPGDAEIYFPALVEQFVEADQ